MLSGNFSLAGKVAVVTGASGGIGGELAAALAQAGATVALLGRNEQTLDSLQLKLRGEGADAAYFLADISQVTAVDRVFNLILQRLGRIDILINNAGAERICASRDVPEALWDRIVDTNLKGAFFCAQAAARRMQSAGCIVNVCSLTSEAGVAGAAAYGASKSGLAGLTRALAAEWAGDGIRVNGIGPGYFRTALTEPFYQDDNWQRATLGKIPMRRFGRPGDLGGAVVFLCSDAAAYVTGQIIYIDGGFLAAL